MRRILIVVMALTPALAGADEVYLRGGGRVLGEIVERRPDGVVIEVGPGRVTLPASRIERVVNSTSPLAAYRARAARLHSGDLRGWLELGFWARDQALNTQAGEAFEHVLALDPSNAAAQRAVGHVLQGGRWMTLEDSYRARGLMYFNGSWMTAAEREAALAERAFEAEERRARAEADARAREADARTRAAEAEARRIEAESTADGGFPYPWIFGGGGVILGPGGQVINPPIGPVNPAPPPVVVVPPTNGSGSQPPARDGGRGRSAGRSNSRGVETNRDR